MGLEIIEIISRHHSDTWCVSPGVRDMADCCQNPAWENQERWAGPDLGVE